MSKKTDYSTMSVPELQAEQERLSDELLNQLRVKPDNPIALKLDEVEERLWKKAAHGAQEEK